MNLALTRSMIGAEILKLRRSRGIIGFALALTVGLIVIIYTYLGIRHASDPLHHRPAGGLHSFRDAVQTLGFYFGMLAAVLIGAEAGTIDRSSGVFRDLVVTGRSRLALFAVRAPAAIVISLTMSAAAYVIALIATFALAGPKPVPGLGLVLQSAGWIALSNVVVTTLAVGLGSLTGSRAVTITALIGWQAILSNLLLNATGLGSIREGLLNAALGKALPFPGEVPMVAESATVAAVVLLAWMIVPAVLGAWRTRTQDA